MDTDTRAIQQKCPKCKERWQRRMTKGPETHCPFCGYDLIAFCHEVKPVHQYTDWRRRQDNWMTAYCDTCGLEARYQVCGPCYSGNHKHMKPELVKMIKAGSATDMIEMIDGVDCKNATNDGQCICPEMLMLKQGVILKKARVR